MSRGSWIVTTRLAAYIVKEEHDNIVVVVRPCALEALKCSPILLKFVDDQHHKSPWYPHMVE
jgi:hypothetical protein